MKIELIIISTAIVMYVVKLLFVAKRVTQDGSPRAKQRLFRINFYYSLFVFGFICILNFQSRGLSPTFALLFGIILLSSAYSAFKEPSEKDLIKNYARDPGHCGRCEYDLTGNTSGVCSECGWAIPKTPVIVESFGWVLWWRQWEIEYLDNWRGMLASMVIISLAFAGVTVFSILFRNAVAFAIIPALMCLHFAINSIRIAQYGQRQRKKAE